MYMGSWKVDDYLTFSCNTHTPSTGAATDADSVPTYRIYEDETTTPILTGSMALLDSSNTAGLYSERIQLTAANGLEKGKSYTTYITATVGGVEGTMSHTFQMEAEVDASAPTVVEIRTEMDTNSTKMAPSQTLNDYKADVSSLATSAALNTHDGKLDTADANIDTLLTRVTAAVALASVCTEGRLSNLDATISSRNNVTPDVAGVAATPAEVATALTDIHLDHLLAVNYDPASKPGIATALLNELVENDGGVSRYTANALEQAPSGGTNPNVLVDTTLTLTDQTHFVLAAGSNDDDAYNDQAIVVYDASNSDYPSVRKVSDYVGGTRTVTLDSAPDFTMITGDGVKIFVTAPGTSAPTSAQNADAVWDELKTDHVIADSYGDYLDDEITSRNATTPPTVVEIRTEMDTNSTKMAPSQTLNDYKADISGVATSAALSTHDGKLDTVDANVDSILDDTGTSGVLLAATAASAQLVDDIWDEILTAATHNIATSAGRRLRELAAYHITSGTAQAGTAHSITLAAAESATDHIFNRNLLVILEGTGVGQTRTIVDYDGTSKIVVVDRDWIVIPSTDSEYTIIPDDTPLVANHGVATAGASNTITISSDASAINSTYSNSIIQIMAGTGAGQSQLIDSYNGTTKVVTICDTWTTTPDNTSVYVIIPYGVSNVCNIGTDALALIKNECDTALTDYGPNTTVPDVAGIAAGLHTTTDALINGLNDITVADIKAGITDGSYDLEEIIRIIFSACCLKISGGGTATISGRDSADTKDRIVATVDSNGNRTNVVLDGS